jgi:PAS domain S-box-containing protein
MSEKGTFRAVNGASLARLAAALTILVGYMALAGWALQIPILASVLPGAVMMKANTAVSLMLCGGALLATNAPWLQLERLARGCAIAAALIGAASLLEYVFGHQLGIDEILFEDHHVAFNPIRGRMSPLTAATLVAYGCALLAPRRGIWLKASKAAAALPLSLGLAILMGYLWNAGELVTDSWLPPVAVNTALCFALLGAGLLLFLHRESGVDERSKGLVGVEIKILGGFVLSLSLLVVGGTYTYRTSVRLADSLEWVAHTQEARTLIADVYGSLANAELAQRDFLLSPRQDRMDEYQRLINIVNRRLDDLEAMTADNPQQQQNVALLKTTVRRRLDDLADSLLAYQTYGLGAARAILRVRKESTGTNDVRNVVYRMDEVESRLMARRQQAAIAARRTTLAALLLTMTLATLLFMALFRGIRREMLARRRGETELVEANRFLDSLIEFLPVMIFVKDARTLRYVRQNRATLNMLGISREEMQGKLDKDFLPADEAAFILAKDREVLATASLVDVPEQAIDSRVLGTRILHTRKAPILDERGEPRYLLGVSEDITDAKRREQEIRDLNTELKDQAARLLASNKELESFSYSVSHDLRAPLRAIDGFALMMQEDCGQMLDAHGARYLSVIRENSRRMGELIDDLLTFSRLGRQPVARDPVNVDSLVREILEEVIPAESPAPQIELTPLPPAHGDRGLLRQVWTNLIGNAVKYSSKHSRPLIQISGRDAGAETQYSIRDNGVGFSMDYVGKLFGVFQRLHRADEFAGTGVGLAIVHRVVTRHGGRVWAEGEVDRGAVFSFALPKEAFDG